MTGHSDLAGLFETACRWTGARDFLIDPDRRLSGFAAAQAVRAAAGLLARLGLAPGDTVAFLAGPSTDQAVAFFAVAAAGGVGCCLHVRDTDARLAQTLADLAPRIVLADAAQLERAARLAEGAGARVLSVHELARAAGDDGPAPPRRPDDAAAIILSSGTTGAPKRISHTHRSLLATAMMAGPVYGALGPGDAVVVPMAPSFAAWIHVVLPFVALRGRLVFQPAFDPAAYVDLLDRERVSIAALVPTLWKLVLPHLAGRDLPALRVAMFSGEPGTPDLVAALQGVAPVMRSVYLASEGGCGCGIVADERMLTGPGGAAAAGQPVPGGDAAIVDPDADDLRPLAAGETGEIVLRGPSLAAGYQGRPDLTAARFRGGWWRTGDLGRIGADGLIHLRGRLDNRINSGGIKVHAEEIEAALCGLGLVRLAAVVGVPDPAWGERIEAHVVPARLGLTAEGLGRALAEAGTLPRALLPKAIHLHDSLPTGPTGKLFRQALRAGPTDGGSDAG